MYEGKAGKELKNMHILNQDLDSSVRIRLSEKDRWRSKISKDVGTSQRGEEVVPDMRRGVGFIGASSVAS